ncbi:GT4 family glycosyltransferase PelF [Sediminicola luteus]|uniref:Glycosyl transferase n=1 Tax=Sediminicola luteus TaxID=319238 RepID=A0A2A4GCX4_9FLAO|nr:GT4 family glycosyltransferase PelF [Sediminicola luteus]PCE66271.1 glycosyl transferase [Sediminicola luteus]
MSPTTNSKIKVLLITEGTYPYNGGGVSTWAHDLCSHVKNAEFGIYAINAEVEPSPRYELGPNVKKVIQVPIWSPEEPMDCLDYDIPYTQIVLKRERSSEEAIRRLFVPYFKKFVKFQYKEKPSAKKLDKALKGMWRFWQRFDYKKTMTSQSVWKAFKEVVFDLYPDPSEGRANLEDLTTAMRWMYRFLLPLAIEVPKYDLSHLTMAGFAGLPAISQKYKFGTPILLTEHGVFIRERLIAIGTSDYSFFLKRFLIHFSEAVTRLVYYHSDLISTVSKFNRGWEILYGAKKDRIRVVYNGVDPKLFEPTKKQRTGTRPTVVAAARIFELKDILTMIRTCNEVRKKIPDVRFLVYGNKDAVPEYTERCESLIRELGLEDHFVLAGFHNRPEKIYLEGDLSILTSISEGFPYTVIESMSCGIPVVSTDVGGVTEAIDPSCGVVCKPKDVKEIAKAVVHLLQNDSIRLSMGESARKKVMAFFTIDKFISDFESLYAELNTEKHERVIPQLNQEEVFV